MINKVTLLGRIGKKSFKTAKSGINICSLSIATNRKYIDSSGQRKEMTTWHNVNFFNKLADIANKYANVSDLIYIEGEISNKKIDDNGTTRIIHSINGNELKLLPNGKKDIPEANGNVQTENSDWPTFGSTDEVPF